MRALVPVTKPMRDGIIAEEYLRGFQFCDECTRLAKADRVEAFSEPVVCPGDERPCLLAPALALPQPDTTDRRAQLEPFSLPRTHLQQPYAAAAGGNGAAPRAIILSSVWMFNISWRRG